MSDTASPNTDSPPGRFVPLACNRTGRPMQPDSLLQTVVETFAELGAADPESISRTLLLRDRMFVGHRFQCGELHALWMPGGSQIEFHDGDGKLLRTVSWEEPQRRKAA